MRKLALIFVLLFMVSCSGGSSGSSSDSMDDNTDQYVYDVWEYFVSDTSITKSYYSYETDENFIPTGNVGFNDWQLRETCLSENSVRREEIILGVVDYTQTITANDDLIQVAFGYWINRYGSIGSALDNYCVLRQHYKNYSPVGGYNFQDVIEIYCDNEYSTFYAKGIGMVTRQQKTIWSDDDLNPIAIDYSISVANLK